MSVNTVKQDGSLQRIAGGTLYADAPIGTISPFGGSVIPNGYLLCNGQAVSRTTYAELFAVIGTAFGKGDESTTFNVPDLREAVPKGVGLNGKSSVHYDEDGVALGEFVEDRIQDHDHIWGVNNGSEYTGWATTVTQTQGSYTGSTRGINGNTRKGATTEVKAVGVNYIIKAKQVAVPFDVAEYIRNQNVLSDYEDITLPTTAGTAMTMPYDGVYILANYGVSTIHHIYLNGIEISVGITGNNTTGASTSSTILFKKGDTMYRLNTYTDSTSFVEHVAYYKLRDYTGR